MENFHALRERQTADAAASGAADRRVNLPNWDGNGRPEGLFPVRDGAGEGSGDEEER